jgi:hypothetical protein
MKSRKFEYVRPRIRPLSAAGNAGAQCQDGSGASGSDSGWSGVGSKTYCGTGTAASETNFCASGTTPGDSCYLGNSPNVGAGCAAGSGDAADKTAQGYGTNICVAGDYPSTTNGSGESCWTGAGAV